MSEQINNLHVIMVLDESGSMNGIRDDIIGSVNGFIREQQQININDTETIMSLIKFNSNVFPVYEKILLKDVKEITSTDYRPNNNTALYDAVGFAMAKYSDEKNVCIIVVTDGQENSSKEYTHKKMSEMIEKRKQDRWNFIYLSADLSLVQQGENIGIYTSQDGSITQTQNMVRGYRELSQGIIENCSSAVTQIRTTGHMVGQGL